MESFTWLRRPAVILTAVFAALVFGAPAFGASILYDNLLVNPSFEAGNQASGCPADWTCGGVPVPGFTSYLVTAAQYTTGSDGLSGSKLVPDGTHAASSLASPLGIANVQLSQTGLGAYAGGTTYTLDLWIGTPLTLPTDNTTPVTPVQTIKVDFLGNSSLVLLTLNATPSANPGQWVLEQFSFTPTGGQIAQTIGLEIEVAGAGNSVANFDIASTGASTPVPEPASLTLLGLGLIGVRFVRRKTSRKIKAARVARG